MFCRKCGTKISDDAGFCRKCGAQVVTDPMPVTPPQPPVPPSYNPSLVGYSQKINDPVFQQRRKALFRKNILHGLIYFGITILIFLLIAIFVEEFSYQIAMILGGIVGIFVLLFNIIRAASRNTAKPLDSEVIDKKIKEIHSRDKHGTITGTTYKHIIELKGENGKRKTLHRSLLTAAPDSWDMMVYLNVGDKVRYHGMLDYFEKYDKTRDAQVPCAGCGQFVDIRLDNCPACKAPLIKP